MINIGDKINILDTGYPGICINNVYKVDGISSKGLPMIRDDDGVLICLERTKYEKVSTIKYKENRMNYIREYFDKHRDALFTVGIIILVDHFVFNGAFRDKLKELVEKLINKTEKKLLKD